jgi:hypothetical protein
VNSRTLAWERGIALEQARLASFEDSTLAAFEAAKKRPSFDCHKEKGILDKGRAADLEAGQLVETVHPVVVVAVAAAAASVARFAVWQEYYHHRRQAVSPFSPIV